MHTTRPTTCMVLAKERISCHVKIVSPKDKYYFNLEYLPLKNMGRENLEITDLQDAHIFRCQSSTCITSCLYLPFTAGSVRDHDGTARRNKNSKFESKLDVIWMLRFVTYITIVK